jgi:hypothetical protein
MNSVFLQQNLVIIILKIQVSIHASQVSFHATSKKRLFSNGQDKKNVLSTGKRGKTFFPRLEKIKRASRHPIWTGTRSIGRYPFLQMR